jgi:hypothetical protein
MFSIYISFCNQQNLQHYDNTIADQRPRTGTKTQHHSRSNTMDDFRKQILANLSIVRPPLARKGYELEIVTSRTTSNNFCAWVFTTAEPPQAIFKGPVASSSKNAVEALLEATADLVSVGCSGVIREFESQLSHQIGDGAFVLESVVPEPEKDMN